MNRPASEETVPELFNRAFALHQGNRWEAAKSLYDEVLIREPQHAHAIHSLGVIASVEGRRGEAIECFQRAIAINGKEAIFYHNLGLTLQAEGRAIEGVQALRKAVEVNPELLAAWQALAEIHSSLKNPGEAARATRKIADTHANLAAELLMRGRLMDALARCDTALAIEPAHPEALCNRGAALVSLGRYKEAVTNLDRCLNLDPRCVSALVNRATAFRELGRPEDALAGYDQALQLNGSFVVAHLGRGNLLRDMKRFDEALESYDQTLKLSSGLPEAHLNRGMLLLSMQQPAVALQCFDRALILRPDYPEAHVNYGNALLELMRPLEALQCYDKALLARPDFTEGHMNRGSALLELGRLEEAIRSYDQAIALKEANAEAYANRGLAFARLNQIDSAIVNYNRAIAIEPNYAEAYLNRSFARLLGGDYENGWVDYEWRRKVVQSGHCAHKEREERDFREPRWLGEESLVGRTILLHSEQGFGDTIQFCRYAKLVSDRGADVILEVDEALENLLVRMDGVAQLVVRGETLPPFDYQCPLMSLPFALGTRLPSIPASIPYLRIDAGKVRFWAQMLGEKTTMRVGLVWSGGFQPNQPDRVSLNLRRNIPLAKLALLKSEGIEFYSLQKGQWAQSELTDLITQHWDGPEIKDHTHLLRDFSDTAALIENLDLVISVDTAVVHLAGAIGKPVWILNRFDTCWRWFLDRTDSPWYPTARLYRQHTPGDWDAVVDRVANNLHDLKRRVRRD